MIRFYLVLPLVVVVVILWSVIAALTRLVERGARLYHPLMRSWSVVMAWLLGVRIEAVGADRLDPQGSYVFLANHSSYLDILAVGATAPGGALFVYKEELARVPIWGWSLRVSPFIMLPRSHPRKAMQSIRRAAGEIRRRGESIILFPEGTRSASGQLGDFKRGGFLLAIETGVPIVPVAISGSYELLPRDAWQVKSGTIRITYGEPITPPAEIDRATERELLETVRAQLTGMLG